MLNCELHPVATAAFRARNLPELWSASVARDPTTTWNRGIDLSENIFLIFVDNQILGIRIAADSTH